MIRVSRILIVTAALSVSLLSGCASFQRPQPGISEAEVIALRGKPVYEMQDGDIRLLEWPANNSNQYSYMAKIGQDGKLISFEQVLTVENFSALKPGISTKEDVLKKVGHPNRFESEYLPLVDSEVWTYRYKESGAWDSMMHIHFDRNGIVKRLENGLDPLYIRD